jgi:hypothetical protein
MPSVNLDSTDFQGRISSLPRNREVPRHCQHCGSQLGGRRYKGVRVIGGRPVREWRCDCGHGRRLPVELAA